MDSTVFRSLNQILLEIRSGCIFRWMFRTARVIYIKSILIGEKGTTMTGATGKVHRREQNRQDWYEIEVEGYFNVAWFDWLDGWEITSLPGGNTLLFGRIIDQPALHGIFARMRDLDLKIISLNKCARP